MKSVTLSLALLVISIPSVFGSHFRGGTISYGPNDDDTMVEVVVRVGFKLNHNEAGFESCTEAAKLSRQELNTPGRMVCPSCPVTPEVNYQVRPFKWICNDYDEIDQSSVGNNSMTYPVIPNVQEFQISHELCCWINPLRSPINPSGALNGWKMFLDVNTAPRTHGYNMGRINSSPVAKQFPLEKYHRACDYYLVIPESDPDGDEVRCRFADSFRNECPEDRFSKACGAPTQGVTIFEHNCTLHIDARVMDKGYHAVNVILEDFIDEYKPGDTPLSRASLQFLLQVDGDGDICNKPTIIDPPTCQSIRPGEMFQMVITAQSGDPNNPVDRIRIEKPFGLVESDQIPGSNGQISKNLTWNPTPGDIGEYLLFSSAVDADGFTSGTIWTKLYVTNDLLEVDPGSSRPTYNEQVGAGNEWLVHFTDQIRQPRDPAAIHIVNTETGEVVYEIDASSSGVFFGEQDIIFTPPKDIMDASSPEVLTYTLRLDDGVASPIGSGCGSRYIEWQIRLNKTLSPLPTFMTGTMPSDVTELAEMINGNFGKNVWWTLPTATPDSGEVEIWCEPTPGHFFTVGQHTVYCMMKDSLGQIVQASFLVTVLDREPPTFTGANDIPVTTTSTSTSAIVTWTTTANDNSGMVTVTSNYRSGDSFGLGATVVTLTAVDPSGNTATTSFSVTVTQAEDMQPPDIKNIPADITELITNDNTGVIVTWTPPTATDECNVPVVSYSTYEPGHKFSVGEYVVTYYYYDCNNNEASASFNVRVLATCRPPPAPQYGYVTPVLASNTRYANQQVVTFSCNAGFLLLGVSSSRCEWNYGLDVDYWTNPSPICHDINECSPNPCQNGAACTDGINGYTCTCVGGYTGLRCEININECNPNPCLNGGACRDGINGYTCACIAGYTGFRCETNINECNSNPCQNGGACRDGISGYTCTCVAGYTGFRCEININECNPNPCFNGATCMDGINGFTCACVAGYTGSRCEININECIPYPCLNGATCTDVINGYICSCLAGYTGIRCETNINECSSNPCQNSATCTDRINGYTCTCVAGYTGSRCEININECIPYPCFNGATCTDGINGYTCSCLAGYAGLRCETNINECNSNPCQNGATCTDRINGYTCACVAGYTGSRCERNIDECILFNPCQNGAPCVDGINSYTCICLSGWDGQNCERNINECNPNPCQNGGACIDGINRYTCNCLPGYTGSTCQTNINECNPNPCQNGGACTDGINSYTCNCLPGYTGSTCETNIDECGSSPCMFGDCMDNVNGFMCRCYVGYTGISCETNIDDCSPHPCLNSGTCIDGINSYTCDCALGFTGSVCHINIDDCSPNPCLNFGTCIDGINSFNCNCAPGYTGSICETNINECNPNPCYNGGACTDGVNSFTCNCLPGYTGSTCLTNINECNPNPCLNGGTCVDGINRYTCTCRPGWFGVNCESNANECASSPCVNGQCMDNINGYTCACFDGYTGTHCEINIDECASSPCIYGQCTDEVNGYRCICFPGYTGTRCEENIDECDSNPCLNGGQCIDRVNTYSCFCNRGYEGNNCQTNIDDCETNPCLNGGRCIDGIASYSCICDLGFTGDNCQTNIDDCVGSPCLNSGQCMDGINSYTCDCLVGFSGDNCQTNTNDCRNNPCRFGGTCIDGVNSYTCICTPGFSGSNCAINIDECANNPCANGGRCIDRDNSYTCICIPGFTGSNCQTNIDDCAGSPCRNGGQCIDGINSYTCNCLAGFSGPRCQTNINDCAGSPCLNNGRCIDGVNNYTCNCRDGFSGLRCETNDNECASSPCLNGQCIDQINTYRCECFDGFSGIRCETNDNECISSPCQNGGQCIDQINSYTCDCLDGFYGLRCETDNNECISSPCLNGGQCVDLINSYRCECSTGYGGPRCETLTDQSPPTIQQKPDKFVDTTPGQSTAPAFWDPPRVEDDSWPVTVTSTSQSGAAFPIGSTVVTYTAVDLHGNSDTMSFVITVRDPEDPRIWNVPGNIVRVITDGSTSVPVDWIVPNVGDNSNFVTLTSSHSPGYAFPIGNTTVTYTAMDPSGNRVTASFIVTVIAQNTMPLPVTWRPVEIGQYECSTADVIFQVPGQVANNGEECQLTMITGGPVMVTEEGVRAGVQLCCGENCDTEPDCQSICTDPTHNPVCDDRGITHVNECGMQRVACQLKTTLNVAYMGECIAGGNGICSEQNIEMPSDRVVYAQGGADGAFMAWIDPTERPDCYEILRTHAPGDYFNIGDTEVTYLFRYPDDPNNPVRMSFTVTVLKDFDNGVGPPSGIVDTCRSCTTAMENSGYVCDCYGIMHINECEMYRVACQFGRSYVFTVDMSQCLQGNSAPSNINNPGQVNTGGSSSDENQGNAPGNIFGPGGQLNTGGGSSSDEDQRNTQALTDNRPVEVTGNNGGGSYSGEKPNRASRYTGSSPQQLQQQQGQGNRWGGRRWSSRRGYSD